MSPSTRITQHADGGVLVFRGAISIGAVVPFLGVLTSSVKIADMQIFRPVLAFLEMYGVDDLRLVFTLLFVATIVVAGFFRISYY